MTDIQTLINDFRVFSPDNYSSVRKYEDNASCYLDDYKGFFYVLEFGDRVKIGSTACPYQRLEQLKRYAAYGEKPLGFLMVSKAHTNYIENEHEIHEMLSEHRIAGTELFNIDFMTVLNRIHDSGLVYKDAPPKIRKDAERFSEALKRVVMGDCESTDAELAMRFLRSPDALIRVLEALSKEQKRNAELEEIVNSLTCIV